MTDSSEPSDTAATADDGLEGDIDVEQWRAELEDKRAEKDEFFAQHPQSPVPPEERDDFAGVEYFDPDPTYRVHATATVHDDPEVVLMDTTAGREMRYLRLVTLEFDLERDEADLEDGTYELAAYQLESPNEQQLFIVPGQDDGAADLRGRALHGTRTGSRPRNGRRPRRGLQPRVHALLCLQRDLRLSASARGKLARGHDSGGRALRVVW